MVENALKIKNTSNDVEEYQKNHCGFKSFRPQWLQTFASINWFLLFMSIMSVMQGLLVNGLTNASIPHLEKEFGLSSTQSGLIVASNDLSGLLFVLIVSYYGDKGRKPRWLGCGSIIVGVGALLFTLPKLLNGPYAAENRRTFFKDFKLCGNQNSTDMVFNKCKSQDAFSVSLLLFCIAQFIMGVGTTPLFTLGASYLDENVKPKNSPIYIGVWYMTTFLGPSVGYLVGGVYLKKYVDIGKVPNGLQPKHDLWVGRWWMPYLMFSGVLIVVGFCLMLFPKEMPATVKRRERKRKTYSAMAEKAIVAEDTISLRGFFKATLMLLYNHVLVLTCLAITSKTLSTSGLGTFLSKLLSVKFDASPSKANFYLSILVVSGTTIGLLFGTVLMRQLQHKGPMKVAAAICAVTTLFSVSAGIAFLLPGCETIKLAGVNYEFPASVPENQRSFAMGLQFLLLRSLGFLPGPILFGKIVDHSCIVWNYNDCRKQTSCAEYDIDMLSKYVTILFVSCSVASLILYSLSFKFSMNRQEEEVNHVSSINNKGFHDDTKL